MHRHWKRAFQWMCEYAAASKGIYRVAIIEARLHKGNCDGESHIIRKGAPDVTKRSEVEVASECGVHDNTETCYLIQDIDLGVSHFNLIKAEPGSQGR